jgi:hypothetical protein
MPREIQESRRCYINRRSDEMALSGAFANCHAIEVALRLQGYVEAREVLEKLRKRELLTALCAQSRRAIGDPPAATASP